MEDLLLTINSGSSSIKFSLYRMGRGEMPELSGKVDGIGRGPGLFHVVTGSGKEIASLSQSMPDHAAAFDALLDWLDDKGLAAGIDAVGHRLVHGGPRYREPRPVTDDLLEYLVELSSFAPEHLPHELAAIYAVGTRLPAARQVACFDTAFHRDMPEAAKLHPLPLHLREEGIIRYGFHGLSYEYIMEELVQEAGEETADGRVIIAHLGNGASMAAVSGGRCIDTTMGFTPAGGLVMSTRSGDLDPGVLLYLLEQGGMKPGEVKEMVNRRAGLLGISGRSGDMRELLSSKDASARMAVRIFCRQARKFTGALAATLGGVETLVFTGGIGENSAEVRRRICSGLEFMGISMDDGSNENNAALISTEDSPVTVRVMKTNEELMIARHTMRVLFGRGPLQVGDRQKR